MATLAPIPVTEPQSGLSFSKAAGHLYRPLVADDSGTILLWDREFGPLFDLEPALKEFLTIPVYLNGGDTVIFSKFESGRDVLADTYGLDDGVHMPRNLYHKLCAADGRFRRILASMELTESQQGFASAFALPDPAIFPSAYRVRKAGLFSRKKLYVLWGMVPENPRAQPTLRMGAAYVSQGSGQSGSESSNDTTFAVPLDGPSAPEAVVYDEESEWPRWLQLLLWFFGFLLLLAILGLLLSLLLNGCQEEDHKSVAQVQRAVPSIEDRKERLQNRLEVLRNDSGSNDAREQLRATENALKRQEQALEADKAYQQSAARAKDAEAKAAESNDPDDRKNARNLRIESGALKGEADASQKKAEDAFRSPQETDRRDRLDKVELEKGVIDADQEYRQADSIAKDAQSKADNSNNSADRRKAEDLGKKAKELKEEADRVLKKAQDTVKSPEDKKKLDALKDITPDERKKLEGEYDDLNSKKFITPKNSAADGEVLVRRFKPDEIVPKGGLRLHMEAEANGRRDFRVKGWRLGLNPLIEKERLETFVPVGPDLDVDVPLDLSFEYRGRDGKIHEDTAPFTLEGDLAIIPRIKIKKFKESPQPKPEPIPKFDPQKGA